MKKSTQWSNLYSAESKYNVQVYYSIIQRLLIAVCLSFIVCLFLAYWLSESSVLLTQLTVIPLLVLLIVIVSVTYTYNKTLDISHRIVTMMFDLDEEGVVTFPESKKYNLHVNSRVGVLGCWLVLEISSHEQIAYKRCFIFKDSVTALSYSRLCRTINRNAALKGNVIET